MTTENIHLNSLMQNFSLNLLNYTQSCYQSYYPTCIDIIFANKKISFKFPKTVENGLLDHPKFISTVVKYDSSKGYPKRLLL